VEYSTPAPKIVADGPNGNIELLTATGDVIFNGTGLTTAGGAGIVGYDNATSGLGAGDVQAAIDELAATPVVTKLDTLWAGDLGDVSDTIYAMDNFYINGELIVDSIQAVGSTIFLDDNIEVDGDIQADCIQAGGGPAPSDVLLEEGFEGGTFPPTGWTQNYIVGTTDWWQGPGFSASSFAHTGSYCAVFDYDGTRGHATELITPSMDLSTYPAGTAYLEFWHMQPEWFGDQDTLALYYSDDGGSNWYFLDSWSSDITAYVMESYVLPDLSSDYMIKFYGYEDYGYGVHIDDVKVYAVTGPVPLAVNICDGDITADGDIEGGTFTLNGITITDWPTGGSVNLDTLWMSSGLTTDTMVAMAQFKVFGELIADSIQAAGSMIEMDDSVTFNDAVSLSGDSTFRTDWEAQHVITVGFQNADFMTIDEALNAISINGWTHALIDVAPGIFPAGMLVIPRGVHLRGSGAGVTEIIGQVQVNGLLSRLKVTNPGPTVIQGDVSHCHFECPIMAGDALGNTSISDCVFRGSDLLQLMETGRIENSNIYMGISGEGSWSIKNCELYGRVTVQKMAAPITEFHITGCDFSNSLTIIGDLVFVYLDASYFHFGDGAAVQVDENAFLEAKANHFVDCITGISIGSGGSAVILSNDFTANIMFGVSASSASRVDVIGNSFVSRSFTQTAISLNLITDQAIIKDNVIEGCLADAVSLNACPSNTPIDNNFIKNSIGNGIVLQGVVAQVLRNTLINNGDGASSFDLFDMSPMGTVASYNVLDTYFPVGSGAFPGAFNTNTMGAIWTGIQTGQLP
ncbi:MAG: right-handed parallel beta-helix repeat-containing protein, partial [bacterium]